MSSVLRVSAEPRKPWAFIFKISGVQGSGNTMWSLPNVGCLPGNPPGRPGAPRATHKVWVGQERNLPIGWRWNWSISAFILALGRRNFLRAPRIHNHKSLSMWLYDLNSHFLSGPKTQAESIHGLRLVVSPGYWQKQIKIVFGGTFLQLRLEELPQERLKGKWIALSKVTNTLKQDSKSESQQRKQAVTWIIRYRLSNTCVFVKINWEAWKYEPGIRDFSLLRNSGMDQIKLLELNSIKIEIVKWMAWWRPLITFPHHTRPVSILFLFLLAIKTWNKSMSFILACGCLASNYFPCHFYLDIWLLIS